MRQRRDETILACSASDVYYIHNIICICMCAMRVFTKYSRIVRLLWREQYWNVDLDVCCWSLRIKNIIYTAHTINCTLFFFFYFRKSTRSAHRTKVIRDRHFSKRSNLLFTWNIQRALCTCRVHFDLEWRQVTYCARKRNSKRTSDNNDYFHWFAHLGQYEWTKSTFAYSSRDDVYIRVFFIWI